MIGYIKQNIDFNSLQKDIDAAKALDETGREKEAKKVLKDVAEKINNDAN